MAAALTSPLPVALSNHQACWLPALLQAPGPMPEGFSSRDVTCEARPQELVGEHPVPCLPEVPGRSEPWRPPAGVCS